MNGVFMQFSQDACAIFSLPHVKMSFVQSTQEGSPQADEEDRTGGSEEGSEIEEDESLSDSSSSDAEDEEQGEENEEADHVSVISSSANSEEADDDDEDDARNVLSNSEDMRSLRAIPEELEILLSFEKELRRTMGFHEDHKYVPKIERDGDNGPHVITMTQGRYITRCVYVCVCCVSCQV